MTLNQTYKFLLYIVNKDYKFSKIIVNVNKEKVNMQNIGKKVLKENGFNYSVNVKIANEYFPTRTYNNTTLESGYYDAVIVELGDAVGDNWWCVMYPPLCFVGKNTNENKITFKSRLSNWFGGLFNK